MLVTSLSSFISHLSEDNQNEISSLIVNNYVNNKLKLKLKYAYVLFKNYHINAKRTCFNKLKAFLLTKAYDLIFEKINDSQYVHSNKHSKKLHHEHMKSLSPNKTSCKHYQQDSFLNRQEKFSQRMKEAREKSTSKLEEEMKSLYTFSPKVNNKVSSNMFNRNNKISPDKKDENIIIRGYYEKSKRSIKSSERNLSPSAKRNLNALDKLYREGSSKLKDKHARDKEGNKSFNAHKKVVSKDTFNKMHMKYIEYANNKKMLQKAIDKELGITFKPKSFTSKSGYVVNSNFEDRNKKLIEDRNNFAFVYDYLRQSKDNENVYGGGNSNKLLKECVDKNNREVEEITKQQALQQQLENEVKSN